ncbi:MAG: hypothetical protein U0842_17980 [Candidatus Binatia bacterium]
MNAQDVREQVTEALEPYVDLDRLPGREEVERMDRTVRSFVAERPVTAVLLALATGYVVGRVLSRIA